MVLAAVTGGGADVPALLAHHCVPCHGDDSVLDLRRPPPDDDTRTWLRIVDMVESFRMPPPARDRSLEHHFAMSSDDRDALLQAAAHKVGALLDPPTRTPHLRHEVWQAIVRELGDKAGVDSGKLEPLVAASEAYGPDPGRGWIAPLHQVGIDHTSQAVCSLVADADFARAPTARRLLLRADGDPAPLLTEVYGRTPTADDVARARARLSRLRVRLREPRAAWVGLCVAELSGPRLWFLSYREQR